VELLVVNQGKLLLFVLRIILASNEIFYVSEVLVVAVEVSLSVVRSLGPGRVLEIAEEVQIVDEFFFGDFILILLPLLLYFWIKSVLSASTAYFLFQWYQFIDLAF
jgi:hypothetical protein